MTCGADVLGEGDEFLDHSNAVDGPVVVAAEGFVQPVAQLGALDDVRSRSSLDLVGQKASECLDCEVPLLGLTDFGQELVGQDREVGPTEPRRLEHIQDAVRHDCAGD